jgi:6-phosphogluconolactonase
VTTSTRVDFRIHEDADGVAAEVADLLAATNGDVVLTGGSTPRLAYELAAERRPDWSDVSFWWGDERCVGPDDERSNYDLARAALLARVERLGPVHRIHGELGPARAAALYDEEIGDVRLDVVLLGIGPDGHTASLFPRSPALDEQERAAVPAEAALEPFVPRVTLTPWKLAEAPLVVFLATGRDKAEAVARAFASPPSADTPAGLVRSRNGTTLAVLDRAAASRLQDERPH